MARTHLHDLKLALDLVIVIILLQLRPELIDFCSLRK